MPRLQPRLDALRALFARSGNRCTFPGCTAPLVNEKNQFVAQICHIEAAEEGGERFSASQTDEERRSYDNLLLLCYPHHVETNDVTLYSVARLRSMKAEHERTFGQKLFQIDESLLHKVAIEMAEYWQRIDHLHKTHHVVSNLAVEIDASATFLEVANQASTLVGDLSKIQEYLIESDKLRNQLVRATAASGGSTLGATSRMAAGPNDFEILYIGFTNTITKLTVALAQMEIKHLEEFVKLNPSDLSARQRLERRKSEFAEYATSAGYVD